MYNNRSILDAIVASGVKVSLPDALAIADAITAAPVSRVAVMGALNRTTGCGLAAAKAAVDSVTKAD